MSIPQNETITIIPLPHRAITKIPTEKPSIAYITAVPTTRPSHAVGKTFISPDEIYVALGDCRLIKDNMTLNFSVQASANSVGIAHRSFSLLSDDDSMAHENAEEDIVKFAQPFKVCDDGQSMLYCVHKDEPCSRDTGMNTETSCLHGFGLNSENSIVYREDGNRRGVLDKLGIFVK